MYIDDGRRREDDCQMKENERSKNVMKNNSRQENVDIISKKLHKFYQDDCKRRKKKVDGSIWVKDGKMAMSKKKR